jgi:uncharacterized secreted protein with C-terminal beta-propeller domain
MKTAAVALIAILTTIALLLLLNITFPARADKVEPIKTHNEKEFKKLRTKHGNEATKCVIYVRNSQAYYCSKGQELKFQ